MCIRSGERKGVLDVGLRARGKVNVVDHVSGVAIAGDGDVFFINVRWSLLKVTKKLLSQSCLMDISAQF